MSGDEVKRVTVRRTTETIVRGLQRRAYTKALALKGKLDLRIDLDASRERAGR